MKPFYFLPSEEYRYQLVSVLIFCAGLLHRVFDIGERQFVKIVPHCTSDHWELDTELSCIFCNLDYHHSNANHLAPWPELSELYFRSPYACFSFCLALLLQKILYFMHALSIILYWFAKHCCFCSWRCHCIDPCGHLPVLGGGCWWCWLWEQRDCAEPPRNSYCTWIVWLLLLWAWGVSKHLFVSEESQSVPFNSFYLVIIILTEMTHVNPNLIM